MDIYSSATSGADLAGLRREVDEVRRAAEEHAAASANGHRAEACGLDLQAAMENLRLNGRGERGRVVAQATYPVFPAAVCKISRIFIK